MKIPKVTRLQGDDDDEQNDEDVRQKQRGRPAPRSERPRPEEEMKSSMFTTKCQGDRRTRTLIKTLLSRQLEPSEVDFLLKLWELEIIHAGRIGLAEDLLRRGWIERDGRTVRLSESTKKLFVEATP